MEWNFFVASSDAMLFVAWIYFVRVVVSGYMVCSGYRNTDLLQFVGIAVCASRAGVELQVEVNDDEKMSRITFLLMMMYDDSSLFPLWWLQINSPLYCCTSFVLGVYTW